MVQEMHFKLAAGYSDPGIRHHPLGVGWEYLWRETWLTPSGDPTLLPQSATTPGGGGYLLARARGRDRIGVSLLQDRCVWPDILLIYGEETCFLRRAPPSRPHLNTSCLRGKRMDYFSQGKPPVVCQEPLQSNQGQASRMGASREGRGAGCRSGNIQGVPGPPRACSARLRPEAPGRGRERPGCWAPSHYAVPVPLNPSPRKGAAEVP